MREISEVQLWGYLALLIFAVFVALTCLVTAISYWKQSRDWAERAEADRAMLLDEVVRRRRAEEQIAGLAAAVTGGVSIVAEPVRATFESKTLAGLVEDSEARAAWAGTLDTSPQASLGVLPEPEPVQSIVVAPANTEVKYGGLTQEQVQQAIFKHDMWHVSWEEIGRSMSITGPALRRAVARFRATQ